MHANTHVNLDCDRHVARVLLVDVPLSRLNSRSSAPKQAANAPTASRHVRTSRPPRVITPQSHRGDGGANSSDLMPDLRVQGEDRSLQRVVGVKGRQLPWVDRDAVKLVVVLVHGSHLAASRKACAGHWQAEWDG